MEIKNIDEHRIIDPLSEDAKGISNEQLDFINYGQFPDPDFNYEKNQKIIDGTIEKNRKQYELRRKIHRDGLGERSEMAIDFLRHLERKVKTVDDSALEQYFGRDIHSRLYGEKLAERLKIAKRQQETLGKVLI